LTNPAPQSLLEYMSSAWEGKPELEGLSSVISSLAAGAQNIQAKIQSATLANIIGTTGEVNIQGEVVQILDTAASDIFVDALTKSNRVAAIGCEELENTVLVGDEKDKPYLVQMDPLDGSSNIDVAISIGSIFGIWKRTANEKLSENTMFRPGNEQVAAAYAVYGSTTMFVVAIQGSVQGFTLDPKSRKFILTHPNILLPDKCPYYSLNEGNFKKFPIATQTAITELRDTHSLRYVGSLVADFHRNLLKGGIFMYPGDLENPEGKLRLMYEANPLGYIAEQAGGAASSGPIRILDIVPETLHQRTPLIIGNAAVVNHVASKLIIN
jgi:fructose-1,6-bisphosphatase I